MELEWAPCQLVFKRPFSISHGTRTGTPVVFVRIQEGELTGYGEASLPPYLTENQETVQDFFKKVRPLLSSCTLSQDISETIAKVDRIQEKNTAAKAAIDMAIHDLQGKLLQKPVHRIYGIQKISPMATAYTIPIDDEQGIIQRLLECSDYRLLKVKLGSSDDKGMIGQIVKHSSRSFFVDANEGWKDRSMALEMAHWLAEKKCLFIEQPMPRRQIDDLAWLTARSPIPIIADESVQRFRDLEQLKGVFSGINIKLMKCTGLYEAHQMITWARKNEMKIMMGCMSESSCAVSAAAQLAPLVDWVDLDGPLLIKQDYFEGVKFISGEIQLLDLPGLGIRPLPNLVFPAK